MNAFFYPSKRGINFAKIRGFKVTDYRLAGALLRRKAADNAKAPLRGKGAGREQELARGVRS